MTCRNKKLFDNLNEELWTVEELSDYLKCSRGHIYNLVCEKEIPHHKKRGMLRFIPSEILNWIKEG